MTRALLRVRGRCEIAEKRDHPLGLFEVALMHEHRDADARDGRVRLPGGHPILGKLGSPVERLFPLAKCEQRVALSEEEELLVAVSDAPCVGESVAYRRLCLLVAVRLAQAVSQVEVAPKCRRRLVVLERHFEGIPQERKTFEHGGRAR